MNLLRLLNFNNYAFHKIEEVISNYIFKYSSVPLFLSCLVSLQCVCPSSLWNYACQVGYLHFFHYIPFLFFRCGNFIYHLTLMFDYFFGFSILLQNSSYIFSISVIVLFSSKIAFQLILIIYKSLLMLSFCSYEMSFFFVFVHIFLQQFECLLKIVLKSLS